MNIGYVRLSAYGQSMLEAYRRQQKLQEEVETNAKNAKEAEHLFKARETDVVFGRKPILTTEQRREIIRLNKEQNFSLKQLAHQFSVSRATVCRVIKEDLEAFSKTEALNGAAFGRKPLLTAEQRREIVRLNKVWPQ